MRSLVRNLLSKQGIYVYGSGSIPKGNDLHFDILRYGKSTSLKTVIDVGANVGNFTFEILEKFVESEVYAVEPASENVQKLKVRFQKNPRVKVLHAAVSDHIGEGRLNLDISTDSFHSLNDLGCDRPFESVDLITIDSMLQLNNIQTVDLLKTDTEGHDVHVLRGATNSLQNGAIKNVVCEVGFHRNDKRHSPFREVWSLLEQYGFELVGFYDQGRWWNNGALDFTNALFRAARD